MPRPYDDIFLYLTLLPFGILACTFRLFFLGQPFSKQLYFLLLWNTNSIFCSTTACLHHTRLISYSSVLTRINIFSFTGGLGSF